MNFFLAIDPARVPGHEFFREKAYFEGSEREQVSTLSRPIYEIKGDFAKIFVKNVLVDHPTLASKYGDATSYEDIAAAIDAVAGKVRKIFFLIDSPGGEVAGLQKLAQKVRGLEVETEAVVDYAASAAYYLAAHTKKITATSEWVTVGSVGVVSVYLDFSGALEKLGLKKIVFLSKKSPEKYVDPASEHGAELIQARIDEYYEHLTTGLALARGVGKDEIEKNWGRGQTFFAKDAKKVGMIDEVVDKMRENVEILAKPEKFLSEKGGKVEKSYSEGVAEGRAAGLAEGLAAGEQKERQRVRELVGFVARGTTSQKSIAAAAIESGQTQAVVLADLLAAASEPGRVAAEKEPDPAVDRAPDLDAAPKSDTATAESLAAAALKVLKGVA